MLTNLNILAIDIGGTKIRLGLIKNGEVISSQYHLFQSDRNLNEIESFLIDITQPFLDGEIHGISIGVPCIVNEGVVMDAVNIPAWKHYNLRAFFESTFKIATVINNDVNCFAAGEHALSNTKTLNLVGLCLGTGVGAGLIANGKLYTGINSMAGEIGSIPYQTGTFDDYVSGSYFKIFHQECGAELCQAAASGCPDAKNIFKEFAKHVAAMVSLIMFAYEPQKIVIGGSVSRSFSLFEDSMLEYLNAFPSQSVIRNTVIEPSQHPESALLGAAHLFCQKHIVLA